MIQKSLRAGRKAGTGRGPGGQPGRARLGSFGWAVVFLAVSGAAAAALLPSGSFPAGPWSSSGTGPSVFFAFERELWMETVGATLVKAEPERYAGNPVIDRGEGDAHDSHRVASTSLLPEGGRLRAWYGSLRKGAPWYEHYVAYAESEDGLHWKKPALDLVRPGTNLILEGPGALIVTPDPEGGYRAAAQFWREDVKQPGAQPGATFSLVRSRDGYRWDFDPQAATDIRHFEIYGFYRRDGLWWILGQGVSPWFHMPDGRRHRRVMYGFHSADGRQATLYPRPLFHYSIHPHYPDAGLQHHVGAGIWDRGRLLIGFAGQMWPSGFGVTVRATIGLIYSYDGLQWIEPFPEAPFLLTGEEGAWDDGMLGQVQRPVNRGERTYFFYTGGDGGNTWDTQDALGLAFLRRDGLAYYTPEAGAANLITVPLQRGVEDKRLYVNSQGRLTVQLLDGYLRPISEGMTLAAGGVRTAALDLQRVPAGSPFRLSFRLEEGARLYTFMLGPDASQLPALDQWE